MKCFYKKGKKECSHPAEYTCSSCHHQEFYCKRHAGDHFIDYKHEINLIESDLSYLKKQIKSCISIIAKSTDYVVSEIR